MRTAAFGILLIALGGCDGTASAPATEATGNQPAAPAVAGDDWPLWRGDAQATGKARSELPERLKRLWTFSVDDAFNSAAVIARQCVLAATSHGKLYAVDLATGKQKWVFSAAFEFIAPPAVSSDGVYIGDVDGRFYAIDLENGRERWHFDADAEIDASANFYAGNVLFGSQNGFLYCLDAASGKLVWKYESPNQIRSTPTIVDDRTFVAGCDGRLHVVSLADGKQTADVDLGGPTGCTPAASGAMVYVGTEEGRFYGIDWREAKVVWSYENRKGASAIRSAAAIAPGLVIFGSRNKRVVALGGQKGQPAWSLATKGRVDRLAGGRRRPGFRRLGRWTSLRSRPRLGQGGLALRGRRRGARLARSGRRTAGDRHHQRRLVLLRWGVVGGREAGVRVFGWTGQKDRVAPGGFPPGAPTDPNVRNSRIRFLKLSIRYATAHGVDRVQIRQGMACQNLAKPGPRSTPCPPSPHEPLPPDLEYLVAKTGQCRAIARDPVVRRVSSQFLAQCLVLFRERVVAMRPAPLGDLLDRPREPAGRRLPLQNPVPFPGSRPEVREAQEVERPRFARIRRHPLALWLAERHQTSFVRVDRQAVSAETFRQHGQHTPRILVISKADHEIVGIADQVCAALQARLHLAGEPFIQHVVQIYIRKYG